MFERPALLWLLLALPLVSAAGVLGGVRRAQGLAGGLSAFLRLATFTALVLMLAGLRIPMRAAARRMAVVIAADQSLSIAPDQAGWIRQQIAEIRRHISPRDRVAVIGFGRDAALLTPLQDPRMPVQNVARV